MPKGRGNGSKRTQFKRSLESRPIAYYQRGERKGQPKICSLCPSFVHVSSRKEKRCPKHMRELQKQRRTRITSAKRKRHVAAILHITTPSPKPLREYKQRAQRKDYKGLFGHIPDNYQDIARRELNQMLTDCQKPMTIQRYAAMVASATAMAKYGGRKEWAAAMLQKRLQKGYWRKQLNEGGVNL